MGNPLVGLPGTGTGPDLAQPRMHQAAPLPAACCGLACLAVVLSTLLCFAAPAPAYHTG